VGVGMGVLGVRYALLLGVLAFFMEFVPVLGVMISGAVCVALALFQGWVLALIVGAYFVVVHVIEGDLIGPRIMGRAVGIHPAVPTSRGRPAGPPPTRAARGPTPPSR